MSIVGLCVNFRLVQALGVNEHIPIASSRSLLVRCVLEFLVLPDCWRKSVFRFALVLLLSSSLRCVSLRLHATFGADELSSA